MDNKKFEDMTGISVGEFQHREYGVYEGILKANSGEFYKEINNNRKHRIANSKIRDVHFQYRDGTLWVASSNDCPHGDFNSPILYIGGVYHAMREVVYIKYGNFITKFLRKNGMLPTFSYTGDVFFSLTDDAFKANKLREEVGFTFLLTRDQVEAIAK